MLYQLALYALGRAGPERSAVILYPTLNPAARDQAVLIREPVSGIAQAEVILRPVHLLDLEALLCDKSNRAERQRRALAHHWAFGELTARGLLH
jgi:hypothetical protein